MDGSVIMFFLRSAYGSCSLRGRQGYGASRSLMSADRPLVNQQHTPPFQLHSCCKPRQATPDDYHIILTDLLVTFGKDLLRSHKSLALDSICASVTGQRSRFVPSA